MDFGFIGTSIRGDAMLIGLIVYPAFLGVLYWRHTTALLSSTRTLWGFLLGPPIAAMVETAVVCVRYGPASLHELTGLGSIIAIIGYVSEFLFGVPLYLLLVRNGWIRFWHFIVLGALSSSLLATALSFLIFPFRGVSLSQGLEANLIRAVPFGTLMGLTLWWFAGRRDGGLKQTKSSE